MFVLHLLTHIIVWILENICAAAGLMSLSFSYLNTHLTFQNRVTADDFFAFLSLTN